MTVTIEPEILGAECADLLVGTGLLGTDYQTISDIVQLMPLPMPINAIR